MYKAILSAVVLAATLAISAPSAFAATSGPLEGSPAAIDVVANDPGGVSFSAFYLPSDPISEGVSMTWTALEDLTVGTISISGVGLSSGTDLSMVSFSLSNSPVVTYFTPNVSGTASNATAFLPGFTMSAGDTVSLIFSTDAVLAKNVILGASFDTAAVPVPAALPLLLTAVGGMAALRARKSRKA